MIFRKCILSLFITLLPIDALAETTEEQFLKIALDVCLTKENIPPDWSSTQPELNSDIQSLKQEFTEFSANQTDTYFEAYSNLEKPDVFLIRSGGKLAGMLQFTNCALIAPDSRFDILPNVMSDHFGSKPSFSGGSGPYVINHNWLNNIPSRPGLSVVYGKFKADWEKRRGIHLTFSTSTPISN